MDRCTEEESEKDSFDTGQHPVGDRKGVRVESLEQISVRATVRKFQCERACGSCRAYASICVRDCESIWQPSC